jgi:hypothetical protein
MPEAEGLAMTEGAVPSQPPSSAKRRCGCAALVVLCAATLCIVLELVPSLRNRALSIAAVRGKQLRDFAAGKPRPSRGDRARGGDAGMRGAGSDALPAGSASLTGGGHQPAFMQHAAVVAGLGRGEKHIISGKPLSTPAAWLADPSLLAVLERL